MSVEKDEYSVSEERSWAFQGYLQSNVKTVTYDEGPSLLPPVSWLDVIILNTGPWVSREQQASQFFDIFMQAVALT